jgi:alpha-1,3-rhamnosyltransferase
MEQMDSKPLVSILLVSMNHGKYIEQCISSVLKQTYTNLEILYLDNNSADDSDEISKVADIVNQY